MIGLMALLIGCARVTILPGVDDDRDGFAVPIDCDDSSAAISPDAEERCGDGIDNNCDGIVDDLGVGGVTWFRDADEDGFGTSSETLSACETFVGPGWSRESTDCDDTRADVRPGEPELCDDVDQDCNGEVDDGIPFKSWYPDLDGDGFGNDIAAISSCQESVKGRALNQRDCDDSRADINPDAVDVCNGFDDDCSGVPDDEGVASVSDVLFTDVESAIDYAIGNGVGLVQVCAGDHAAPQQYDVGENVTLILKGQGRTQSTLRASGSTPRAILTVGEGSELTLEDLSFEGPGVDTEVRGVVGSSSSVVLSRIIVSSFNEVIQLEERPGTSSVLSIQNAELTGNFTAVATIGGVDVTIRDSSFNDNEVDDRSSVVRFDPAPDTSINVTAVITDTEFRRNAGRDSGFFIHGVLHANRGAFVRLEDCILENTTELTPVALDGAVLEASNTSIMGTQNAFTGGGLVALDSTASGLDIRDNRAFEGGGVSLGNSTLADTAIVGNAASQGGGVFVAPSAGRSVLESDCVVWSNSAPSGSAAYIWNAPFTSERANLGAGSNDNIGGAEVVLVDFDLDVVDTVSAVDELVRCSPDDGCIVTP